MTSTTTEEYIESAGSFWTVEKLGLGLLGACSIGFGVYELSHIINPSAQALQAMSDPATNVFIHLAAIVPISVPLSVICNEAIRLRRKPN